MPLCRGRDDLLVQRLACRTVYKYWRADEPPAQAAHQTGQEEIAQAPAHSVYPASLCWVRSSPICSSSLETRRPIVASKILRIIHVATAAKSQVATTATTCRPRVLASPNNKPLRPLAFTAVEANNPVAHAPQVPPTPCTPTTSKESS